MLLRKSLPSLLRAAQIICHVPKFVIPISHHHLEKSFRLYETSTRFYVSKTKKPTQHAVANPDSELMQYISSPLAPETKWDANKALEMKEHLRDEVFRLITTGSTDLAYRVLSEYYFNHLTREEEANFEKDYKHILLDGLLIGYYGHCLRQINLIDQSMTALQKSLEYFSRKEQMKPKEQEMKEASPEEKKKLEIRFEQENQALYMVLAALGVGHFNRNQFSDAEVYFTKILKEVKPTDEYVLFMMAVIGEQQKDNAKAEKYYLLLEKHYGNDPSLIGDIACFYKDCKQDFEVSKQKFEKALEMDPKHPHNLYNFGVLWLHGFNDVKKAEEYFSKALEVDKEHVYAIIKLGELHMMRAEFNRAKQFFKRAMDLEQNHIQSVCNYAFCEYCSGNFKEAEKYYRNAFIMYIQDKEAKETEKKKQETSETIVPQPLPMQELGAKDFDPVALHLNYANCLFELEKFSKAEEQFKMALELAPENISVLGNYALLLENFNSQFDKSEQFYVKSLVNTEDNKEASLGSAQYNVHLNNLFNYAVFLRDKRVDLAKAVVQFEKLLERIHSHQSKEHIAKETLKEYVSEIANSFEKIGEYERAKNLRTQWME